VSRERKSPQQKKELEYTRDHFTFAKHVHAFRKEWPLKKALANRELRRKGDELLAQAKPGISVNDAEVVVGEMTAAQLKKSVSRKRLHKRGTVAVGEKIKLKIEKRKETAGHRVAALKKYSAIVGEALGVLNSLQGDKLTAAVRRANLLSISRDFKNKWKVKQSEDPSERALYVFSSVCFGGNYLCGDAYLIDRIRSEPELWEQFSLWVQKYERILQKDGRAAQRKLDEKSAAERKVKALRRAKKIE
jgi:hypothetical protein